MSKHLVGTVLGNYGPFTDYPGQQFLDNGKVWTNGMRCRAQNHKALSEGSMGLGVRRQILGANAGVLALPFIAESLWLSELSSEPVSSSVK